ncbi:hypothetical protein RJT34_22391 [Clitoria ternatea]|uniref:Uncharacterized protein n=1 Tax=Clitoria ternatea TaxID=43366 RepID=A0AAN9IVM4_CLITE
MVLSNTSQSETPLSPDPHSPCSTDSSDDSANNGLQLLLRSLCILEPAVLGDEQDEVPGETCETKNEEGTNKDKEEEWKPTVKPSISDDDDERMRNVSPEFPLAPKFAALSFCLTREEIEEDFIKLTGAKPPKKPKLIDAN